MERRLPLALFLSFLVLFGWTLCHPPPERPEEVAGAAEPALPGAGAERQPAPGQPAGDELGPLPDVAGAEEVRETLVLGRPGEPGHFEAVFSNRGARLVSLRFGSYFVREGLDAEERADHGNWLTLLAPVPTEGGELGSLLLRTLRSSEDLAPAGLDDVLWTYEPLPDGLGARFAYGPGTGVVFTKEIRFEPGTWRLHLTLGIENRAAGPERRCDFLLVPAGCLVPELGDSFYPEPRAVAVGDEDADEIAWESAPQADEAGTLDVPPPIAFVGNHNKYFGFFLRGATPADVATIGRPGYAPLVVPPRGPEDEPTPLILTRVPLALHLPVEGAVETFEYVVYAGPKDHDTAVADFAPHAKVLDEDLSSSFETISWIGNGLLAILRSFHRLTGNWGIAIILLTVCVRAALFPLNRRTQTAMARYQKKMKRVQPRLEEVKKRFAEDPQKLREAQARIMQEEGAFPPLGGCLPILLQFPVFIGLFSALRTSFDLRQAPFVAWITDLSLPDRLLPLGIDLFFFEIDYLNVLPLVVIALMIVQQRGMPQPTDEQAARMQKMMMVMPFLFAFFLYKYAAGLSLYVITSSAIGILETKVIKKVWPIDDTEPVRKQAAGCGPFSGIMQNLAEKQREQMRLVEERKRAQHVAAKRQQKRRRR